MSQGNTMRATGRKADSLPTVTVDLAALFAELAESGLDAASGQALTMSEIMAKTGTCRALAQRLIAKAQEIGACEPTRARRKGIDGVNRMVQAYVFKAQKGE